MQEHARKINPDRLRAHVFKLNEVATFTARKVENSGAAESNHAGDQ
jgi:hypothetical protein